MSRQPFVSMVLLTLSISGLWPAFSQTNAPASLSNHLTGPTVRLDYGRDPSLANPVAAFMYFVALISPEPVSTVTSAGNTQTARVLSARRKSSTGSFVVTCEFEFTGTGSQQSIFDLAPAIRRHERQLKASGSTGRQLSSITVDGAGQGTIEIEGAVSNSVDIVSEVRLRFNARGKRSPVSIGLCEIRNQQGELRRLNELIARVNSLTFRRKPGPPKMDVTVASVKNKGAGNGLWQSVKGGIKGVAVNLLIDPLTIEAVGHRAMLDFGAALVAGAPTFTFPQAANLNSSNPSMVQ